MVVPAIVFKEKWYILVGISGSEAPPQPVAAGHLLSVTTCPIRNIDIPNVSLKDLILMCPSVVE